jgi:hypothetical protein
MEKRLILLRSRTAQRTVPALVRQCTFRFVF